MKPIDVLFTALGTCAIGVSGMLALRAARARAATNPFPSKKIELPPIEFVPTTNMRATPAGKTRPINVIVIHDAEYPERPKAAKDIANYFKNPTVPSSSHYTVDDQFIVQSVKDNDVAWTAPPRNDDGLHLELIGYAKQTPAEWVDAYSKPMLELAARLIAAKAQEFDIPLELLGPEELKAGKRGITTHGDISKAYGKSDHQDPGKNFPMDEFMAMIRAAR